jgi:hypothetical protein
MALCYFNGSVMNIGKIADFAACEQFECKDSEITAKLIKLPSQDKVNLDNCKLTGNIEYASGEYIKGVSVEGYKIKDFNESYIESEHFEASIILGQYQDKLKELSNDFKAMMNDRKFGDFKLIDEIYLNILSNKLDTITEDYEHLDL